MMKKNNHIRILLPVFICTLLAGCLKKDINLATGTLNPETSLYIIRSIAQGDRVVLSKSTLDGAYLTSGVVVSDVASGNLPANTLAIQSSWMGQSRGILLHTDVAADYHVGDSIRINIDGLTMHRDNGSLTIESVTNDRIELLKSDAAVSYRSVSISALQENFEFYESQLITVTADVDPTPESGSTFGGEMTLMDGEGNTIALYTEAGASFADETIAPSATFQGLAYKATNGIQLRMQKAEDMTYPSGKLYEGWPESYENPSHPKGSYNMPDIGNNVFFDTGEWHLYQAIVGETAGRDRIVSGIYAIRMQQNRSDDEYLQMNFDVENGASKVTFWYGSYYNDRSCTFQLEYSVDQGETWTIMDEPISDAHTTSESLVAKQAIFLMDIDGPVRFRITKLGLGQSNTTVDNGRLGIDDFAIYQNY